MLTEQIVVEDFVKMYYDELMEEIKNMNKKLDDVIETEEFKIWFNEKWVSERWITFVSDKVADMYDTEKNKLLIDYGLDNVFDMFRFIGLGTDSFKLIKCVGILLIIGTVIRMSFVHLDFFIKKNHNLFFL